jgi:hypothetical protein
MDDSGDFAPGPTRGRPNNEPGWSLRTPMWPGMLRKTASALDWLFGWAAILTGLAVLSAIPLLNFLSLGYLLEVSARVAKSGRFRAAFVGVRKASMAGRIVIGVFLVMIPVRLVASYWNDARLVAPGSDVVTRWRIALIALTLLTFAHIIRACLRGGRLRHFLWPAPGLLLRELRHPRPGALLDAADRVGDWAASLRLPHYFWLGFRGFVGAVVWLAAPVGVLILAGQIRNDGIAFLVNLFGAGMLMLVVLYLPFLQARFALTGRVEAMFQVGQVRALFGRAPVAFWFALLIALLSALPLYLLKIELTPRAVAWLPALFFVAFVFPARVLTGWALHRATVRDLPRHGAWRWLSRLAALPVAAAYVFFVWVTQYLSWRGSLSLLEQHAFLVPTPLIGL